MRTFATLLLLALCTAETQAQYYSLGRPDYRQGRVYFFGVPTYYANDFASFDSSFRPTFLSTGGQFSVFPSVGQGSVVYSPRVVIRPVVPQPQSHIMNFSVSIPDNSLDIASIIRARDSLAMSALKPQIQRDLHERIADHAQLTLGDAFELHSARRHSRRSRRVVISLEQESADKGQASALNEVINRLSQTEEQLKKVNQQLEGSKSQPR